MYCFKFNQLSFNIITKKELIIEPTDLVAKAVLLLLLKLPICFKSDSRGLLYAFKDQFVWIL